MPHADSALVPPGLSKSEFWVHVYEHLASLLEGQRSWVVNLANTSSLLYNSLRAFPSHFGDDDSAVNWCGFYVDSNLYPVPRVTSNLPKGPDATIPDVLLLGPFCGKPACQLINVSSGRAKGVCADAFLQRKTMLVPDVDTYPGHIACDGETKSEIVCPLIVRRDGVEDIAVGVMDLDCLAHAGFTEEDEVGLERIAELVVKACDW